MKKPLLKFVKIIVKIYIKKLSRYFFDNNYKDERSCINDGTYKLFKKYFSCIDDNDDIFKESNALKIICIACFWIIYKFCIDDDDIKVEELVSFSKIAKNFILNQEMKICRSVDYKIIQFLIDS